jgi:hypothetical protein
LYGNDCNEARRVRHNQWKSVASKAPFQSNDQVVTTDPRARIAQYYAKHPANPIAIDRSRKRFAADHHPDSAAFPRGWHDNELQILAVATTAAA